jgi:hypothetical protein
MSHSSSGGDQREHQHQHHHHAAAAGLGASPDMIGSGAGAAAALGEEDDLDDLGMGDADHHEDDYPPYNNAGSNSQRGPAGAAIEKALGDIDQQRLGTKRGKKGQCPSCGTQLFKVGLFGKKKPLNERGKVFQGICLQCFQKNIDLNDFAGLSQMGQSFNVPKVLSIPHYQRRPSGGNATVVSGITLDVALIGENSEPGNSADSSAASRSQAAALEERRSPAWKRDGVSASKAVAPASGGGGSGSGSGSGGAASVLPRMETLTLDGEGGGCGVGFAGTTTSHNSRYQAPHHPDESSTAPTIQQGSAEASARTEGVQNNVGAASPGTPLQGGGKAEAAGAEESSATALIGVGGGGGGGPSSSTAEPLSASAGGGGMSTDARNNTDSESTVADDREATPTVEDIPKYVALVHMPESDKSIKIAGIRALASSVWEHGAPAEIAFARSHGFMVATKLMWDDISDGVMQEAILNLLMSVVAPREGKNLGAVIVGEGVDACIDALLITMHTLIMSEPIQQTGCTILCFLASACSIEPHVNDGTASGAVLAVLSAMEAHPESIPLQEWGVRTLYHQCIFSRNAEGNKRTLACRTLASGEKGSRLILRAFRAADASHILADRLCKLYWCLTANEDLAQRLQPVADVFVSLLTLIQQVRARRDASTIIEAALGSISNFTKTPENCRIINADKAIALALEVMCLHKGSVGVLTEACCVIANLAVVSHEIDGMIEAEGIETIVEAMSLHSDDAFLMDEGLRALVTLAGLSDAARERFNDAVVCQKTMEVLRRAADSEPVQCMACRLISYVCRGRNSQPEVLQEILHTLSRCMVMHLDSERAQDGACSALRIISAQAGNRLAVKSSEIVDLILTAMDHYRSSKLIQLNACCVLWNVSAAPGGNDSFGTKCIGSIVEAMKAHLETDAVLEMACSALWTLIHGSEETKRRLVGTDGSIEALTCVLAFHPTVPALLEKVVGVLSSLSSSQDLAARVVSTATIDAVLDVVRNYESVFLLHFCILFLKNAVVVSPEYASSVKDAIPIVLKALKSSHTNADFQHGACVFLWVVALSSSECKADIVASDGMTTLMIVLQATQVQAVQDAALGAMGALAMERDSS